MKEKRVPEAPAESSTYGANGLNKEGGDTLLSQSLELSQENRL